ncbi:MAG: FAD-binding oxidoreductase [Roseovarius sp.]|nr:FAD-binding oxidoreductase [Roseovarius sp.]
MNQDRTLWRDTARERVPARPFDGGATVDLAVIGGGFTGCAAALEAARRGASVALLEAGRVGDGGSGRNVGLVNAGLWLPPDTVLAAAGPEAGARLLDALAQGPATVFDLIAREGIDCEATRAGTLHLAHAPSGLRDLRERLRQGNRHGAPLQLLDAAEIARRTGGTGFHGALFDPRAGTVQPLAYARGLARAAAAAGARIHEATPVENIRHDGDVWTIEAAGHSLRAAAVLLATNAYHRGAHGLPAPQFVPVGFSQFATAPLPEALRALVLPGGEGCWDTAAVMSSFRTDCAGRLILGGIGDVAGPASPVHAGWARRKLRAVYPDLADLPFEHAWSGRIAMTGDHLPKVVAPAPRALAIHGYSGRGIAPGTVFGTAAARTLLSGDPAHLPLPVTDAHAERLAGLRRAGIEAGAVAMHLIQPRPFA